MTSIRHWTFGARLALGLVLGAALLLQLAAPAHANGVHVGSREVFAGEVGPYRLNVSTVPVTGMMHFIFLLSEAGTGEPVEGVALELRGTHGDGATAGPVAGYQSEEGPQWFAADVLVEPAGVWDFTLTIDSPLGAEQAAFPVAVQEPSGGSLTIIILIVVALAILGFTLGNRMFGRRRRRVRGRRPQE